jgi:hypothetical protein
MFDKLFHWFWPQPEPAPNQLSLAVAALLRTEASAQEAGIDLRPSTREPIPDNSKVSRRLTLAASIRAICAIPVAGWEPQSRTPTGAGATGVTRG